MKAIADVAVRVVGGHIVPIWIGQVGAPLVAVVRPRDFLLVQFIANVAQRRWGNSEDGLVGIADVGIRVSAVTVVAGIVVIQKIEVIRIAAGTDGFAQRAQIVGDRGDAGLGRIGTVGIEPTA